jgi:hypothetical protein
VPTGFGAASHALMLASHLGFFVAGQSVQALQE